MIKKLQVSIEISHLMLNAVLDVSLSSLGPNYAKTYHDQDDLLIRQSENGSVVLLYVSYIISNLATMPRSYVSIHVCL